MGKRGFKDFTSPMSFTHQTVGAYSGSEWASKAGYDFDLFGDAYVKAGATAVLIDYTPPEKAPIHIHSITVAGYDEGLFLMKIGPFRRWSAVIKKHDSVPMTFRRPKRIPEGVKLEVSVLNLSAVSSYYCASIEASLE